MIAIAKEGFTIILVAMIVAAVLVFVGIKLWSTLGLFLGGLGLAIVVFVLLFFRDPDRTPPPEAVDGQAIVAPADGKVVLIKDINNHPYIGGPARQLSIFLSLLDVHVNRIPATGVIEHEEYIAGDYLVAWHPKSSEKNERAEFGLRHVSGEKLFFKVIAGAVARRIVYHIQEGQEVVAGERFGVVKFGSRMDVIVPQHIVIDVHVGDTVRAGTTLLATLPVDNLHVGDEQVEERVTGKEHGL